MFIKAIAVSTIFPRAIQSSNPENGASPSLAPPQPEDSSVDPCHVLCHIANAGDCGKVRVLSERCSNLLRNDAGRFLVSETGENAESFIYAYEAFAEVSTPSCDMACEQTLGCSGSFCKPNNHCYKMFWQDKQASTFCFHTESQPCNPVVPLLCDATGRLGTDPPSEMTTQVEDELVGIQSSDLNTTAPIGEIKIEGATVPNPLAANVSNSNDTKASENSTGTAKANAKGSAYISGAMASAIGFGLGIYSTVVHKF
jgi:hypothetical protein